MWDEIIGDEVMRDILSALYFLGEATPFELGKVTGHNPATITRRLQRLRELGIISDPIEDSSTGRLRRIYKAPPLEEFYLYFKHYLMESFRGQERTLHNFILDQLFRIFNLPHKTERDVEDVLKTSKNPTWILVGLELGYWKLEDNKLVVTDEAIETLKDLYEELLERYFFSLWLLDAERAFNFWIHLGEEYLKEVIEKERGKILEVFKLT